jgi:hypothetical protein
MAIGTERGCYVCSSITNGVLVQGEYKDLGRVEGGKHASIPVYSQVRDSDVSSTRPATTMRAHSTGNWSYNIMRINPAGGYVEEGQWPCSCASGQGHV